MEKTFPLNSEELKKLTQTYPTPFYLYDEKAIRENMRKFTKAFSIFPKFREHFAVKACPNPYILKILAEEGCGGDCSSLPELMLCEIAGIKKDKVIFTSNETPASEFKYAFANGNIINLDDFTHTLLPVQSRLRKTRMQLNNRKARRSKIRTYTRTDARSIQGCKRKGRKAFWTSYYGGFERIESGLFC